MRDLRPGLWGLAVALTGVLVTWQITDHQTRRLAAATAGALDAFARAKVQAARHVLDLRARALARKAARWEAASELRWDEWEADAHFYCEAGDGFQALRWRGRGEDPRPLATAAEDARPLAQVEVLGSPGAGVLRLRVPVRRPVDGVLEADFSVEQLRQEITREEGRSRVQLEVVDGDLSGGRAPDSLLGVSLDQGLLGLRVAPFDGHRGGEPQGDPYLLAIGSITSALLGSCMYLALRLRAQAVGLRDVVRDRSATLEALVEKTRDLELVAYTLAHDLRAPIRALVGYSKLLEEEHGADLSDAARRYVARIEANAKDQARLLDDLLRLHRISTCEIRRQRVDLGEVTRVELERLRRQDPDREVDLDLGPDLQVQADHDLVVELVRELVENAWRYTRTTPGARLELRASGPGAFVLRDNGEGFPEHQADRVLRAFERLDPDRDREGTGVGLAIVSWVVRRHGGRVRVTGSPGKGACFEFDFGPGAATTEGACSE